MKIFLALGSACLFLAALLFYAEQNKRAGQASEAVYAVERVLQAESRSLGNRLDEAALKADRDVLMVATRWRKRPPMKAFLSDTALSEPGSPKWVIVAGRRIRAAGIPDDALLEDALEAHMEKPERFALYASRGKFYLFVRGSLTTGQPFASAYAPESFFSAFQAGEGLRVWIAGRDGRVIFHPLQRFIGANVANLRPVAAGLQKLTEGRTEQFTLRYLGLEGKEALGAWAVLAGQGLLVASEWPRDVGGQAGLSALFWLGLALSWLGFTLMGLIVGMRRVSAAGPRTPLFDEGRLDEDAMEYLEAAKASADEAIELARAQEASAAHALQERSRLAGIVRRLEGKIALLEGFQENVLPRLTGKQVWAELASIFSERAPGLAITVYRYSPSSFSLVPEACFGGGALPEEALAYLRDARIFVGNPALLSSLLKTEAFGKWSRACGRHMPLHRSEFRVFPFAAQGGRGAILALFDERLNEEGELEDALTLMEQLVRRAGTFCDSLTPLLQSSYAKASAGPALAGAPDGAGNRPRSS